MLFSRCLKEGLVANSDQQHVAKYYIRTPDLCQVGCQSRKISVKTKYEKYKKRHVNFVLFAFNGFTL